MQQRLYRVYILFYFSILSQNKFHVLVSWLMTFTHGSAGKSYEYPLTLFQPVMWLTAQLIVSRASETRKPSGWFSRNSDKSGSLERLKRIGVDYVTSSSVSFTGVNNLRFALLYPFQAWVDSYCHNLRPILVTES